ncbi:hypothetical protein ABTM23_19130, partial [Acinetobacter baumannii]
SALQMHRGELSRRLEEMWAALPGFGADLASAADRITAVSTTGRTFGTLLWQLALAMAGMVAIGHFMRRGLITLRHAILHDDARPASGRPGLL